MADRDVSYPRTGFVLPETADWSGSQLVDVAVDAVDAGFGSVWTGETWGYDPFALLGRVAERTSCPLGTCIANVYARSPASLAMNALTLQEATDGRFVLGLGASTPVVVRQFHGGDHERPLRRVSETIRILDLALSGESVDYDGDLFDLEGFALNHAGAGPVPVFNAALGPKNLELTVERADGVVPHLFPLAELCDKVEGVAADLGVDDAPVIAPSVPTSVDADGQAARDRLSAHVAYYVGSSEYYADAVAAGGFAAEAEAVRAAWRDGDTAAAAGAVSEALLDAVGIVGTPERAADRLEALLDGPVDAVLVSFPNDATESTVRTTIDALGTVE